MARSLDRSRPVDAWNKRVMLACAAMVLISSVSQALPTNSIQDLAPSKVPEPGPGTASLTPLSPRVSDVSAPVSAKQDESVVTAPTKKASGSASALNPPINSSPIGQGRQMMSPQDSVSRAEIPISQTQPVNERKGQAPTKSGSAPITGEGAGRVNREAERSATEGITKPPVNNPATNRGQVVNPVTPGTAPKNESASVVEAGAVKKGVPAAGKNSIPVKGSKTALNQTSAIVANKTQSPAASANASETVTGQQRNNSTQTKLPLNETTTITREENTTRIVRVQRLQRQLLTLTNGKKQCNECSERQLQRLVKQEEQKSSRQQQQQQQQGPIQQKQPIQQQPIPRQRQSQGSRTPSQGIICGRCTTVPNTGRTGFGFGSQVSAGSRSSNGGVSGSTRGVAGQDPNGAFFGCNFLDGIGRKSGAGATPVAGGTPAAGNAGLGARRGGSAPAVSGGNNVLQNSPPVQLCRQQIQRPGPQCRRADQSCFVRPNEIQSVSQLQGNQIPGFGTIFGGYIQMDLVDISSINTTTTTSTTTRAAKDAVNLCRPMVLDTIANQTLADRVLQAINSTNVNGLNATVGAANVTAGASGASALANIDKNLLDEARKGTKRQTLCIPESTAANATAGTNNSTAGGQANGGSAATPGKVADGKLSTKLPGAESNGRDGANAAVKPKTPAGTAGLGGAGGLSGQSGQRGASGR